MPSLPLYEKVILKNTTQRYLDVTILFLLLSLLFYGLLSLKHNGFAWFLAFLCESCFTFVWELPPLDIFVTTADPYLEPPILTVNTVLSLLAVDYPAHRLACYVSDDGCSPLNFYSLKYNIRVRAPFRYFLRESDEPPCASSWEFQQDWEKMKVIWENMQGLSDGIPHLIYISREKRPKNPHHYKAGAMNVLTRVSSLMTNAPFMLNVDCDMYANNPELVLQAILGFVQCPQYFYDRPTDHLAVLHQTLYKGMAGIQGPFYAGSGTFHRRNVVYGLWPGEVDHQGKYVNEFNGKVVDDELLKKFGNSKEFINSAAHALKGKAYFTSILSKSLDIVHQVAGCDYEHSSDWGVLFLLQAHLYNLSMITGMMIHAKGWRSGYCSPDPRAFLGCGAPADPAAMSQQKRWATGFLEILFSKTNPIFACFTSKLQFRQCLAYLWILIWGLRSIPEVCYAALPAYCIITNSSFLPKIQELGICIPVTLFVIYKVYTLSDYIRIGFPIDSWWVNSCMARIFATGAWFLGLLNVILKFLGLSETIFEITQKFHQPRTPADDSGEDDDKMIFDESPVFIPGTTILLVHVTALAMALLGLEAQGGQGTGLGEFFCITYVVLCFLPFLQGLFRRGKYGIPLPTICKSSALALLFVHLRKMSTISVN
ncbi:cellulose synthase-like protein B4 [Citrus sinensis]|uniref:Cellulose synthase-like protein B4 n=1 Tax=Citrus sinensis TaxID=2711 RepID=A0ACB8JKZ9_CITSI|nr:cellulose synthase-like protein B4 [Citrus sinensis]